MSEEVKDFLVAALSTQRGAKPLQIISSKIKHKVIMFENKAENSARSLRRKRELKNDPVISSSSSKKKKLHDIPPNQSYETYAPLRQLWGEYVEAAAAGVKSLENIRSLHALLMTIDYHGCELSVVRCSCPARVGLQGTVIKETSETFVLITPESKIKVIQKFGTDFATTVLGWDATIHGTHFVGRRAVWEWADSVGTGVNFEQLNEGLRRLKRKHIAKCSFLLQ